MAAADFVSMLPHHQMFKQDEDMDNFFDFNQITPQAQQSQANQQLQQHQQAPPRPRPDSAFPLDDFGGDNQIFAAPSHQYDQFRQQTGVSLGDLSHLQQPLPTDPFFNPNTGLDHGTSWQFDDSLMDLSASTIPLPGHPRALSQISELAEPADEEPTNVRLYPGMHQQQAQRAAQAKAQAMALRQARASQSDLDMYTGVQRPRQPSTAASIDDDCHVSNDYMPDSARSKTDDDIDEDERLLASEEGKKLSSKERRQLRNKVSARAFRSRRKEYITQLEGELNVKSQEVDQLKSANLDVANENARYRNLIQFLIRQPAFAPVLSELNKDPAMSGIQGLSLLPPTVPMSQPQPLYTPTSATSNPADPNMLDASMFNGMPFNFQ